MPVLGWMRGRNLEYRQTGSNAKQSMKGPLSMFPSTSAQLSEISHFVMAEPAAKNPEKWVMFSLYPYKISPEVS